MKYMGSKSRIAKYIVPILQKTIDENKIDSFYDIFCGGCNIIDKIECENLYAFDKKDTLIALLEQAKNDFSQVRSVPPTKEEWDKAKDYTKKGIKPKDMTLAEIGAIEFFASYGARGFPGGLAKNVPGRDYYKEAYDNLKNQSSAFKNINFKCQEYSSLDSNIKNAVIYCDIPYYGVKTYSYSTEPKFNYEKFWEWAREKSMNNFVFISEMIAPEDFVPIWEKEITRTLKQNNDLKANEKLFVYKGGLSEKDFNNRL